MLSALIWQFHNINIAISVIHFDKLRNFFRRAAVAICSCKGDFKNSSFLQKTTFSEYLIWLWFSFEVLRGAFLSIKYL